MLRLFILAAVLLVTGCTQEGTETDTQTDIQTGRIQVLEVKGLYGYGVYVIKVDSSEYIVNQEGGIVKHR